MFAKRARNISADKPLICLMPFPSGRKMCARKAVLWPYTSNFQLSACRLEGWQIGEA